jgi:hypothetical protein
LVDPGLIGDIGDDGSIDAATISTLAGYLARVKTPAIPTSPAGLTMTPGGPDPVLSLGAVARIGNPAYSDIVAVPVLLDDPRPADSTGIIEAIVGLTYDPSALTVSAADITLGTIPASGSGWRLESLIDPLKGQIGIDLYSTTSIIAARAGSLVNIAFHMDPEAHGAATVVQLVDSVSPDDRWFSTEVADGEGKLVLSPGADRVVIQPGQHFQVGAQPRLNALLFRHSPAQMAADELFADMGRSISARRDRGDWWD